LRAGGKVSAENAAWKQGFIDLGTMLMPSPWWLSRRWAAFLFLTRSRLHPAAQANSFTEKDLRLWKALNSLEKHLLGAIPRSTWQRKICCVLATP